LLDDRAAYRLEHGRRGASLRPAGALFGLLPDRRDPHPVVDAQACLGTDPAAIYPHFTPADDPEYPRPGHINQPPDEVLVEALAGVLLPDLSLSTTTGEEEGKRE